MESLIEALCYSFLGGVLLNFMPCVFPILSIKALSLINLNTGRALNNVIHYILGILTSFFLLSLVTILLKESGHLVGWGYHMQSPIFITILILILFAVGMNLSGFYKINQIIIIRNHAFLKEYSAGILTTLVASPCTTPFMAIAMGYALAQSNITIILTFLTLGIGMSFPYLILGLTPNSIKLLPKPGQWMIYLKQFLAFPIYGAVVWLIIVLSKQIDSHQLAGVLLSLVHCGFVVWVWQFIVHKRFISKLFFAILFSCILLKLAFLSQDKHNEYFEKTPFSTTKLNESLAKKQTTMVAITASWCITCKINDMLVINTEEFANILKKHRIIFLEANWTKKDDSINRYMESFKRSGIPLYIIYGPDGSYNILNSVISINHVLDSILQIEQSSLLAK